MSDVNPIPAGYNTITASLVVKDTATALEYYKKAFGATLRSKMDNPMGGPPMHVEMQIGNSIFMMGIEMPQMEYFKSPESVGGTAIGLHLYVEDVDAAFNRVKEAGVQKVMMEPEETFWGDRYCQVIDPFGHVWSIASRVKNMTEEEMMDAFKQWMKSMQQ
ncbi:VOC family protein [bacterium]|nr:VOC family protein [bacterium]